MPIRLIALDLDDTLLRADLRISEANKTALKKASALGLRIVLASGRNIHSMKSYAEELDAAGPGEYMICTNGAEILETATGRRLYERGIEGGLCREIAAALKARGFSYQVYEGGTIYASQANRWTEEDRRLTGQRLQIIAPEEEADFLARGQVKFVVPGEPEKIMILLAQMRELFAGRAEVLTSKPYFLEILASGVDKGEGLRRLCELLEIGLEDTMAAGDAMNDLGMLGAAGLACVPSNAVPAAKALAGHVSALTNDEDFVADVVERFVLAPAQNR